VTRNLRVNIHYNGDEKIPRFLLIQELQFGANTSLNFNFFNLSSLW